MYMYICTISKTFRKKKFNLKKTLATEELHS